jgi:S-adenosylmethionine decarboxylase
VSSDVSGGYQCGTHFSFLCVLDGDDTSVELTGRHGRTVAAMIDLAPEIYRQRAVLEGTPNAALDALTISNYLSGLSDVLKMRTLIEPVTHRSPLYGEAAWIHWESSGAHFYAWETPQLFFSVDIYTCKPFSVADAVDYTRKFFRVDRVEFCEF